MLLFALMMMPVQLAFCQNFPWGAQNFPEGAQNFPWGAKNFPWGTFFGFPI
jgi:hypothetical protein